MARKRRSQHSKKQKETARKRGPSYLRKGFQLGQKANIIAGGFYEEPTHRRWCISCHIPEGRELPDLQAIFRDHVDVQQVPYDLRSGKKGTTIVISSASNERVKKNIVDTLSNLSLTGGIISARSTPSLSDDGMGEETQQSADGEVSTCSDWEFMQDRRDPSPGNEYNYSQAPENHSHQSPKVSIQVAQSMDGCEVEGSTAQEDDFMNWNDSIVQSPPQGKVHLPSNKDVPENRNTTGSPQTQNSFMKADDQHQGLQTLAAAAATKHYMARLLLHIWD
ncbi:hypothetical protein QQS21_007089 [Conoideocrella luteorostrata]|uniref:Uncharacterized protein n=1 Tax=Conoideocrella luteorostrata TaxID=1105319 RepID=A0AAJ0FXD0_9HYPO|nr:hypothetical protein QQS21_007089 [Conoideocrella luteorostrata]